MENKEKTLEMERFNEFIHSTGMDLSDVALKAGFNRQTLYYASTGRNAISVDVHRGMARAFPNYDLRYQMMGERSKPSTAALTGEEGADALAMMKIQAENARMKIELEYYKKINEETERERAQYWQALESMHSKQLNFTEVNSTTTGLFNYPRPAYQSVKSFTVRGEVKPMTGAWTLPGFMRAVKQSVSE